MENSSTQLPQASAADPNSGFRLSTDLILHAMQFLDPPDILSMRKTCRMFHRTTKARIVWLVALERICETHGIFKPTFPTNRMSLLELEHAALSPHRFVESIKAAEDDNLAHPYQNRSIPRRRRAGQNSNEIHEVDKLFLVPGGRFLLTSGRQSGVCLWDLGYNAKIPINPFPIATLDLPNSSLGSVAPGEGARDLLLAVTIRLDNATVVRIYRVDPEVPSKGFSMEGQLEVDGNLTMVGSFLCSDMVYLTHQSHFILWNWIKNTGCKWKSQIAFLDPMTIYACKQSMIAYNSGDDICVWDTPTLISVTKPNLAGFDVVENPQRDSFKPLLVDETDILFSGTSIWQQQSVPTLHLLRLIELETGDEDYNLIMYSLRDTEKLNDPFLPRLLPVSAGRSHYIHGDTHPAILQGAVSPLFNCDNHLVFCTGSKTVDWDVRQIVAVVLPIPSQFSKDNVDPYPMTLTPTNPGIDQEIRIYQIGFCPMSGRLVYPLSGGEELRLMDYLWPPGEPSRKEPS